jgi:hypothetical protein
MKHGENCGIPRRNANVFILVKVHIAVFWAMTTDSDTVSILKVDHEDIVSLRRVRTRLQDYTVYYLSVVCLTTLPLTQTVRSRMIG